MNITLFRDLPTEHWLSMERYADELASELPKLGCAVESYVAARPLPQLRGAMNAVANYAWRSLIYPRAASKHQSDINHIVDHSYAHLIHTLDASRTIVTCHDLAPLALNEGRGIGRKLWNDSFRAMLSAAHIIADSAFTRDEILRRSDYPAERIAVVPLAVGADFIAPVSDTDVCALRERRQLTDSKIILHVGSCAPRKNIEMILRVLGNLREHNLVFVQVGGIFSRAQFALIGSLGVDTQIIQIQSAAENELRIWYHTADALVFPSTYEGFGLPILEAMASGAPVISTNVSSIPEVAGDAALLVDPHDLMKLAEAITTLLTSKRVAEDLRQRGQARARLFTWQRTARETLAVYQHVMEQR